MSRGELHGTHASPKTVVVAIVGDDDIVAVDAGVVDLVQDLEDAFGRLSSAVGAELLLAGGEGQDFQHAGDALLVDGMAARERRHDCLLAGSRRREISRLVELGVGSDVMICCLLNWLFDKVNLLGSDFVNNQILESHLPRMLEC